VSQESLIASAVAWAIIVLLAVLVFFIRVALLRRAVLQVIAIFRKHNSLSWHNAKTARELGLATPGFLARIGRPKDYKPQALKALLRLGIIRVFREDRLYLNEDRLRTIQVTGRADQQQYHR
jgi:hypothetical protein